MDVKRIKCTWDDIMMASPKFGHVRLSKVCARLCMLGSNGLPMSKEKQTIARSAGSKISVWQHNTGA